VEEKFLEWVKNGDNFKSSLQAKSPYKIKVVEKVGADGKLHRNFIT
jgi:hypothetical protein